MAAAANNEQGKSGFKGFTSKITRSFKDLRGEIKKVVWPSKKQIINNTGIVLVFMAISAIFVGGIDLILSSLVNLFLRGA